MDSASTDVRGLVGLPLAAGDVTRDGEGGRLRAPHERHGRLAGRRRRRAHPARAAGFARGARALDGAELRTAAGDRTGVRLEGAEIPGGESVSEPPPLGAVQITPNGEPFVLLVDRYRTGGYAKPAVVHPDDLPIIAQLLPGMRVTFKLVEPGLRWDLAPVPGY